MACPSLDDPGPNLRHVLVDKYVNFKPLYDAIDSGFDHHDVLH